MNEQARKKARRAELERLFLDLLEERELSMSFADWICANASMGAIWHKEAKELIALYEEEM